MRHAAGAVMVAAVLLAVAPYPWAAPMALTVAIAVLTASDRTVLVGALRVGIVLGVLFASAVAGAVVAWRLGPLRGLINGGAFLCRLLVLWLATGYMARRVDADAFVAAARRAGLDWLALVLGLALNALPRLVAAAEEVWIAHRVRQPSRLAAWRHAAAMAEVLLAHTARLGQDAAAAAALRGHAGLLYPRSAQMPATSPVVVVSGRRGSGKTTAVEEAVAALRTRGVVVAGVLQPAELAAGERVGFRLRNLVDGTEAPFARRVEREDGELGTSYVFAPDGMALARAALLAAPGGSVLVVDELGPLELRGQGHMPALQIAVRRRPQVLVLVVRRHLIPILVARLHAAEVSVVDVDTAHDPVGEIVEAVQRVL